MEDNTLSGNISHKTNQKAVNCLTSNPTKGTIPKSNSFFFSCFAIKAIIFTLSDIAGKNSQKYKPAEQKSKITNRSRRWGKEQDRQMYQIFIKLASEGVRIGDIQYPDSLHTKQHYLLLLKVKREMQWVGTTRQILQRINLLKQDPKLSVRDQRYVRKLARAQLSANRIDINSVVKQFPFKNIDEIKSTYQKIRDYEFKNIEISLD